MFGPNFIEGEIAHRAVNIRRWEDARDLLWRHAAAGTASAHVEEWAWDIGGSYPECKLDPANLRELIGWMREELAECGSCDDPIRGRVECGVCNTLLLNADGSAR